MTALIVLAVAACSPGGQQSVAYYRGHSHERAERVNRCLAETDTSRDCRNAKQADFEASGIPANNGEAIVH